jgi:hypothetical protein
VVIGKKAMQKTTFIMHDSVFEHLAMLFGLTNILATYQRLLNMILDDVISKYRLFWLSKDEAFGLILSALKGDT